MSTIVVSVFIFNSSLDKSAAVGVKQQLGWVVDFYFLLLVYLCGDLK
jgi:hypothetical protein